MTSRDVGIDYLRASVTLLVLAHHSSLAYTTFARINPANYLDATAPIVDSVRWAFLDYAENFNDVFFMSMMFFLSGLFVWPAIRRHGPMVFLRDRLVRLGLPFLVGVTVLMPVAYYASWRSVGGASGFLEFWGRFLSHGWPSGPLWFIWVLLLFDVFAAFTAVVGSRSRLARPDLTNAGITFGLLYVLAAVAYIPMLAKFGFGLWRPFLAPPLWFQVSRVFLYLVWFVAGIVIGAGALNYGLLPALARRWPWWLAGCLVAYNVLWFAPDKPGIVHPLLWVLSCTASCFGLLALFRGVVKRRRVWMDSLARCAYILYLIHYVFLTWAQYLLLRIDLPAPVKFAATFAAVVALSWSSAVLLLRVPRLSSIL